MKKNLYKPAAAFCILIAMLLSIPAMGQRYPNNPISQYYRDGYLWNPALAGSSGTGIYGLLNKSWMGFDDAPTQVNIAGEMKLDEKNGIGIRLISDKSGILQRSMGAVSYAYTIGFNEDDHLRIGGDLSIYKERVDEKALISEGQEDASGIAFNNEGMNFDGNAGFSLEIDNFSIGATGYNLGAYLKNQDERPGDLAVGQVLSSYRFKCGDKKFIIQPLMSYKLFYEHDNIFTVATQLEYNHLFHTSIYWQNTGNVMAGLGVMLKDKIEVNVFYSGRNKYAYNEQYEAGIKWKIK